MNETDRDHPMSRRRALALIAGGATASGLLEACGRASAVNTATTQAPDRAHRIMLIRHAEKPVGNQPPHGVTIDGIVDGKSLTVLGWQRAGALVELFDPSREPLRPGLVRPTRLFASNPGTSGSKRPLETITPLAQRMNMKVQTPVKDKEIAQIAAILRQTPGSPLAAWQHQDIPAIAEHLGPVHPAPPKKWPGDRFDIVWVFTAQRDGTWAFTQVPQLLLAGDTSSVIT